MPIRGLLATTVSERKKHSTRRIKKGLEKLSEAMRLEMKNDIIRGNVLPKDWRNRVLK